MNAKMKRRMVVVTGVIVIVLIVVLTVVGSGTSAKTVSVSDAASGAYAGERIQVSGNVVENSFYTEDNVLVFDIYDPEGDAGQKLNVRYDQGVSATFGNDVTAICTGKMGADGTLHASQLVTKCPSKYENATDALDVAQLAEYEESIQDKPVKITGTVKAGSLSAVGQKERMVLVSSDGVSEVSVAFAGALSDEVADGAELVVTGSLQADGTFSATDVALKG